MKKYCYSGWTYKIDEQETLCFYKKQQPVFNDIADKIPQLTQFLIELCVDISKPCNYCESTSDLLYYVYGEAKSETGYEIDFYGDNAFATVVMLIMDTKDIFLMEIFGL